MKRAAVLVAACLSLLFAAPGSAQDGQIATSGDPYSPFTILPAQALHGGDYLRCWMCDLVKVRNIQGGDLTGDPEDLNLDIGAGSTANPGTISFQWDVGDKTRVFDGQKGMLQEWDDYGSKVWRSLQVCTDICREVATVAPKALVPVVTLRRMVRLERRVALNARRIRRLTRIVRGLRGR